MDFGNPSGHSYVPFPLYEPLISNYLVGDKYLKLAWLFILFFGVVVPFSRIYLGVHSLNQVLFGLRLGLAWVVLFRYGLREKFYQIYSNLFKKKSTKSLAFVVFTHISAIIIPIIAYQINKEYRQMPHSDMDNLNSMY